MWNALRIWEHVSSESTDNMRNATSNKICILKPIPMTDRPCHVNKFVLSWEGYWQIHWGKKTTTFAISLEHSFFRLGLNHLAASSGPLISSAWLSHTAYFARHINDNCHHNDAELTISLHWHFMAEWNTLSPTIWTPGQQQSPSRKRHWRVYDSLTRLKLFQLLRCYCSASFERTSYLTNLLEFCVEMWSYAKLGSLSHHIFAWLIVTQGNDPERNKETKVLLNIY